ncbi:MAG: hypothetical protein R2863_03810 [Candidatus Kapaibacterium sp.]
MIVIDTNSLIVFIIGIINNAKHLNHPRTSDFDIVDFKMLLNKIGNPKNLIVISNVWTEVDNLLNESFQKNDLRYYKTLKYLINLSTEPYIKIADIIQERTFEKIGVTDSLLLNAAIKAKVLVTFDDDLERIANHLGIEVYNLRTEKVKNKVKSKRR